MALGDCLVAAAQRSIQASRYFPHITFKIGTIAALALHSYGIWYSNGSKKIIFGVLFVELFALYMFSLWNTGLFGFEKTHLIAYANKEGAHNFPINLGREIGMFAFAGGYLINGFRLIGSGMQLYNFHKGIERRVKDAVREFLESNQRDYNHLDIQIEKARQLNEKDIVLFLGSCILFAFSLWAMLYSFNLRNQYKPNFSACY